MGYYTNYMLAVRDAKTSRDVLYDFLQVRDDAAEFEGIDDTSKFKDEYIAKLTAASNAASKINANIFNVASEHCEAFNWYDHEKDMLAASVTFPDWIFELSGEGEDYGDIWVKWFWNGKMQGGRAELVLPQFNPDGFGKKEKKK